MNRRILFASPRASSDLGKTLDLREKQSQTIIQANCKAPRIGTIMAHLNLQRQWPPARGRSACFVAPGTYPRNPCATLSESSAILKGNGVQFPVSF